VTRTPTLGEEIANSVSHGIGFVVAVAGWRHRLMVSAVESTSTVRIHPLADHVVVRPKEETQQLRGGLHLPDTAVDKPQQGEVVAAGPGRIEEGERIPMQLHVGQRILFEKYGGIEVTFENGQYLIIKESDVLAVIA
jgi:chaperonin GroES